MTSGGECSPTLQLAAPGGTGEYESLWVLLDPVGAPLGNAIVVKVKVQDHDQDPPAAAGSPCRVLASKPSEIHAFPSLGRARVALGQNPSSPREESPVGGGGAGPGKGQGHAVSVSPHVPGLRVRAMVLPS